MQDIIILIPFFIISFFLHKEKERNEKQINRLLDELESCRKAILARNLTEYAAAEYMTKPEELVDMPDDILDATELDDNQFKEMISKAGEIEEDIEI